MLRYITLPYVTYIYMCICIFQISSYLIINAKPSLHIFWTIEGTFSTFRTYVILMILMLLLLLTFDRGGIFIFIFSFKWHSNICNDFFILLCDFKNYICVCQLLDTRKGKFHQNDKRIFVICTDLSRFSGSLFSHLAEKYLSPVSHSSTFPSSENLSHIQFLYVIILAKTAVPIFR